uniref:Uncharacterized protein n=1 Tax=viral metagenome TaxID=1070528 RepID=A0A6M3L2S7_9ZZZZ
MSETNQRGRPHTPANSRKSKMITLKLTPGEDAALRKAAAEARLTLRDFLVSRAIEPDSRARA